MPDGKTLSMGGRRRTAFIGPYSLRPASVVWFMVLWLALFLLPGHGAAETIKLSGDAQQVLRGKVGYCTLPPGSVLPESPDQACAFQARPLGGLPSGFSEVSHWVRFTASNPADYPLDAWLEVGHSRLQRVILHRKVGDEWQSLTTGQAIPSQQRPLTAQRLLLPFSFQPGETAEFVLQVSSMTQIELTLRVWRASDYFAHEGKRQIVQALAMGGLMLAAAFSLMVYLRWRDPALIWLAASFVSQVLLDASYTGMLSAYFWPAETGYDVRLHGVLVASTVGCIVQFVRNFLHTTQHYRIEDGVLRFALVALVLGAAAIFHWGYALPIRLLAVIALVSMATCIIVFYRAWRDGSGPAGYLLFGYLFLLLMIMQRASVAFGWIDAGIFQPVGYSWYFVLIAPTILLGVLKRTDALRDTLTREVADREAQSQLLTRMSHELRSPLNTVITQARLLQRVAGAGLSPQRVDERAGAIIAGARRLLGMIDELLDHARVRAGRMSLYPVPLALPAYLQLVADDFRDTLANSGNTLKLQLEDGLPEAVSVDANRLRQVLDNLLSNASRYCHNGRVTLACAARRVSPQRHTLSFAVSDSGPGIDADDQREIFQPFQRGAVGQRSGVDGLGVGLSIAGDLVRLMGGQLQLESRPGQGSRFFFTIEVDEALPLEAPPDVVRRSPKVYRILVVEDERDSAEALVLLLENAGFDAKWADSAAAANARSSDSVDLVITDQFMRRDTGWTVLRHWGTHCPVILVSSAPPAQPADLPVGLAFSQTFLKPLDVDALFDTLAAIFRFEWIETPLPAWDSPEFVGERPDETHLAALRTLIEQGAVSDLRDWAKALIEASPEHTVFAQQVLEALAKLDFDKLTKLST